MAAAAAASSAAAPAGSGGAPLPYLGSKISLVSYAGIRYEGILFNINTADSTVGLSSVRTFGTEGRRPGAEVPASDEVFDYIVFRGKDIQDLTVSETVHPDDPAIVAINPMPHAGGPGPGGNPFHPLGHPYFHPQNAQGGRQPNAQRQRFGGGQMMMGEAGGVGGPGAARLMRGSGAGGRFPRGPPASAAANMMMMMYGGGGGGIQGPAPGHAAWGSGGAHPQPPQQFYGGGNFYNGGGGGGYGGGGYGGGGYGMAGGYGGGYGMDSGRERYYGRGGRGYGRGGGGGGYGGGQRRVIGELTPQLNRSLKSQLDEAFDFDEANKKFDKERAAAGTVGTEGDGDEGKENNAAAVGAATVAAGLAATVAAVAATPSYNKNSSFFDNISCEALDRLAGHDNRTDRVKQRQLDIETFGPGAAAPPLRHRFSRGGYRQRNVLRMMH